jgi:hypothetical protein
VRSRVDGGGRGFTDALEGRIDTVDLGLDLEPEDGVIVVPFGAGGLGPEDLVPTTRLDATLAHFVRLGAPVIIEAPPLLSGLAAETLASVADAVVVVVEQGVTRDELERVRTMLAQVGVSPVGAVVVSRERARDGHSRAPVRSDQRAGTSASR